MLIFSELCNPAKIYVVLSGLFIILDILYMLDNKLFTFLSIGTMGIHLVFVYLWTFLLDYLCLNGYGVLAWIAVFFPFILIFIMMILFAAFIVIDEVMINTMMYSSQNQIPSTSNPTIYKIVR